MKQTPVMNTIYARDANSQVMAIYESGYFDPSVDTDPSVTPCINISIKEEDYGSNCTMNYTICGNDYSYDVNTRIVTILKQITSTNLCFGVHKYLQPQTKILLNPISLAIGGIQTTTGDMPYVTASLSQTFTVSDISKMPKLSEWHIYGNEQQGRFSVRKPDEENLYYLDLLTDDVNKKNFKRILDKKQYELKDHLGNVRVAIGDMKIPSGNSFVVDEKATNDYYPFGMLISDRSWSSSSSRYGYGGHEMDNETKGIGNQLSFGDYGYDPRLGRRWQLDPEPTFGISEYATFNNNPILFADPDGKLPIIPIIVAGYYISSKLMEKSEGNDAVRTVGYSMRHLINAFKTNGPFLINHNDVATNFQVNIGKALGVKNVEGGVQNAIRHTLWQALLTKDMGAKAASRIGNAHETTTNIDINQRAFKGITAKDDADRTIDLLNNKIGRAIGEQNKDADNVTMAKAVVNEFYNNGLYTMTGNDNDGYKVQKTKLTKEEYETAIKEIDKKGQDGKNKKQ